MISAILSSNKEIVKSIFNHTFFRTYTPPSSILGREVKNFRKLLADVVRNFYFSGVGGRGRGGSRNFEILK